MKSILDCNTSYDIEAHDRYIDCVLERIYERFKDSHDIRTNNGYVLENILELPELLDMYDYKNGCDIEEKMGQFVITMYGQFLDSHDIVLFKD